ncbi:MAG: transposase [Pirellulales bacterium]|nr:transposase [Pirellulales bacterium]
MKEKYFVKVAKFEILKPANGMTWKEFRQLLMSVRYRVFRLANLCVSENFLQFHLWRKKEIDKIPTLKISELNRQLREMLLEEKKTSDAEQTRICKRGALPASIVDALSQYKIRALTAKSKWRDVIRGNASLPSFRNDAAIPICCHKPSHRRLEKTSNGNVELELMICMKPYPRIILKTEKISGNMKATLERLLANRGNSDTGYQQRFFEVVQDRQEGRRWYLHVTYKFPASLLRLNPQVIVGIDLGFSCPLYAAINNGLARLGWRHYESLGKRIRNLQNQVFARRRSMQSGGNASLTMDTARGGHGRKRILRPIEKLAGRVNNAYSTLNHQLSRSVIEFAKNHGAGVIQMENLEGLKEQLTGTFLGSRWRYHELQQFIEYKAKEVGIEVRKINPQYTSRRCSECGYINIKFDRAFRDANRKDGKTAKFICPKCKWEGDPDYNAARNLATLDIENLIRQQLINQGIPSEREETPVL